MNIIKEKIIKPLKRKYYALKRYILIIHVEVQAQSLFYPANATVYYILFNRTAYTIDHFKVGITDEYRVNLGDVFEVVNPHYLNIEYSDGWDDARLEVLLEEGQITQKEYEDILDPKSKIKQEVRDEYLKKFVTGLEEYEYEYEYGEEKV